jgi:outer membrane protein OmpA-like peptidoglycan-associated protein
MRGRFLAAVVVGVLVSSTGCSASDEDIAQIDTVVSEAGASEQPATGGDEGGSSAPTVSSSAGPERGRSLGVVPMTLAAGPAHVELLALSRTSDDAVTGQFRITNDGSADLDLQITLFESGIVERYPDGTGVDQATGIGLLDGTGNKLYMPLWTTDDQCLCSDLIGKVVPPGGSADVYAVFPAPPADVHRVSVLLPNTVPFQDVRIGSGPVRPLEDQSIDPATVSLAPPRILAVGRTVEGEEQSIDDNADDRAIRLSSDVLFDINKADLTPRASTLLEGVARQLDESTGDTVTVDGHTDTTGNDAINQPLSERRARTVSRRLQSLVQRQGVTFQEAGHGSKDPVAPNDTEEGRRKNRRVTVTFTRPQTEQQSTPPASSGEPYRWTKNDPAVLGNASLTASEASGLKVEVNSLHRDASGVATLVWTLRNDGDGPVDYSVELDNFWSAAGSTGSAVGLELVDTAGQLRYQPLHASDGRCLCAEFIRAEAKVRIWPGETATFANLYKLPLDLRTVELQIPWNESPAATVTDLTVQ